MFIFNLCQLYVIIISLNCYECNVSDQQTFSHQAGMKAVQDSLTQAEEVKKVRSRVQLHEK